MEHVLLRQQGNRKDNERGGELALFCRRATPAVHLHDARQIALLRVKGCEITSEGFSCRRVCTRMHTQMDRRKKRICMFVSPFAAEHCHTLNKVSLVMFSPLLHCQLMDRLRIKAYSPQTHTQANTQKASPSQRTQLPCLREKQTPPLTFTPALEEELPGWINS